MGLRLEEGAGIGQAARLTPSRDTVTFNGPMGTHPALRRFRRRRPLADPRLELPDIQGNVLRPYGFRHAAFLFARIDDPEAGRAWLADRAGEVTSAAPWEEGKPETTLNVRFTYAGLQALGVPGRILASFPDAFREGMAGRAQLLGDVGANAPANWDPGFGTGEAHVLLRADGQDEDGLERRLDALRESLDGVGEIVNEQRSAFLASGRNHFGYVEGAGAVAVHGDGLSERRGEGTPEPWNRWRALKPGEFILGYEDEDNELPDAPADPLGRNGTYVVYRKFFMDVALFTRFLRTAAATHANGDEELLAAKIMGRWRDGTPLVVSPHRPDPALASDPDRVDDFRYGDDPDGVRCPIGAHIRRANPRDALGWDGALSLRHRMIRRGVSYGPPPEDPAVDDGIDRGLVFTCFVASLERQFETVQTAWIDDGNVFGLGDDKDFLLAGEDPAGKMTLQGDPPSFLSPQPAFVRVRGGEYLFQPGIAALRALAAGLPT
jgi:Dyp-type peroxidase family